MKVCESQKRDAWGWDDEQARATWRPRRNFVFHRLIPVAPKHGAADVSQRPATGGTKAVENREPLPQRPLLLSSASRQELRVIRFLSSVYLFSRLRAERLAVKEIYAFVHEAIQAGDFALIDIAFRIADVRELQPSMAISFLMGTIPVKNRLSPTLRRDFAAKAEKHIKANWGKAEAKELRFYL